MCSFALPQVKGLPPDEADSVQRNGKDNKQHSLTLSILPAFLSHYTRQVFPEEVDNGIVNILESHIEGMEPQFRSASFSHLWHALKEPLTHVFRPKSLQELFRELQECADQKPNIKTMKLLQMNQETVKKALIVCKIHKMLSNGTQPDKPITDSNLSFKLLWNLLRNPLTELLNTGRVSALMQEVSRYNSRFELAGINYEHPTRMSDIMRDVLICKLDDIFNEVFVLFMRLV